MTIGFTSGCLQSTKLPLAQQLKIMIASGATAIEIHSDVLEEITPNHVSEFKHVSVHAPKHDYGSNDEKTKKLFEWLNKFNLTRKLDLVVFHPDPITDFGVFKNQQWLIAFENMDQNKEWGQKVEDIQKLLDLDNSYRMTLDLNHTFVNDNSLKLADDFHKILGNKIAEYHLSGYETLHEPLHQTKQVNIIKALQYKELPIILECQLNPENIKQELDYVKSNL